MSTGLCMFLVPAFRIPWLWAALSFTIGFAVLAIPLLRTSRLYLDEKNQAIAIERSPAFLFVFAGLFLIRVLAREWVGQYLSVPQTGGLFFLLAFGMIIRWRASMLREFRALSVS